MVSDTIHTAHSVPHAIACNLSPLLEALNIDQIICTVRMVCMWGMFCWRSDLFIRGHLTQSVKLYISFKSSICCSQQWQNNGMISFTLYQSLNTSVFEIYAIFGMTLYTSLCTWNNKWAITSRRFRTCLNLAAKFFFLIHYLFFICIGKQFWKNAI